MKTFKKSLTKAQNGIEMNDKAAKIAAAFSSPQNNPVNNPVNYMSNISAENERQRSMQGDSTNNKKQTRLATKNIMYNDYMDSVTNKRKSNTPMMDSMYPSTEKLTGMSEEQMRAKGIIKKTGGTVKSKIKSKKK